MSLPTSKPRGLVPGLLERALYAWLGLWTWRWLSGFHEAAPSNPLRPGIWKTLPDEKGRWGVLQENQRDRKRTPPPTAGFVQNKEKKKTPHPELFHLRELSHFSNRLLTPRSGRVCGRRELGVPFRSVQFSSEDMELMVGPIGCGFYSQDGLTSFRYQSQASVFFFVFFF